MTEQGDVSNINNEGWESIRRIYIRMLIGQAKAMQQTFELYNIDAPEFGEIVRMLEAKLFNKFPSGGVKSPQVDEAEYFITKQNLEQP